MNITLKALFLSLVLFGCGALQAQTTAVQSGNWNDAATWGGAVPTGLEEDIVIPAGIAVTLNADVECGELLVQGRFEIERAHRTLTCDSLIVQGAAAEFEAGTNGNRFTDRFVLTLKGEKTETFGSGGARALMAMAGGTITIHGEDRVEWTHLGANVAAGANAITMSEPVDWRTGDEILICSSRTDWEEAEKVTIASVSGDGLTVTLTSNLAFPHAGVTKNYTRTTPFKQWTADLRAEVGLLSRNITIQGDADAVIPGHANEDFGAHIMIHGASSKGYIKGAELFRVGQKSILGRYPFHWHLGEDSGAGQYFSGNAVHLSFNRAITIHGTDYTTVENNFCYDHIGHGIFLEDGAERFNVIRKNVVVLTKRPLPGEQLTPSDNSDDEPQNRTPASFWITNPENTFEDNVAAGTEGTGYWFIMPTSPLSPSRELAYYSGLRPHTRPLISFARNKAHSCMNGFDIFDQLTSSHAINKNRGWDNSGLRVMDSCTWYANNIAVYAGIGSTNFQENVIYRDNVFVDNKSALMLATYNVTEESVFVADSGEELISGTRSLYITYDGAGRVRNSHFVGWDAPNANFLSNIGGATKHPNHRFSGITTDHAGTVRIALPDYTAVPPPNVAATDNLHPRRWSVVLRDEDGSLSGQADASIVGNHPFLIVGDEYQPPNWTRAFRSDHEFALSVEDSSGRPNVTVQRSKPGTPDAFVYYIDGYIEHHQLPMIVNGDFTYTYYYEALPSNRRVTFRLDDATAGDNVLVRFKDFGKFGGLSVSGHSAIARGSLASLSVTNRSGYYIEPNGDLYIRPVATGISQTLTITWSNNPAWNAFDTDGDGLTDAEESALGRDPFDLVDFGAQFLNNGNFEKWDQLNNITGGQVSGGTLKGTSTGDSQIINADFNFAASGIESIFIRLKASVDSSVFLFWGREDTPGFSSTRRETVSYTGGGDWQTLLIPVGSNSEWINTINTIRVDPISGTGDFEIDWISASDGDADDDGIPDLTEGFGDVDGDGIANLFDTESDGDWTSDADELAAGRDPYDAGDLAMHFNEDGSLEGWTGGGNIDSKIVSGGLLSGIAASGNPQIVHTGFRFDANSITSIMVRFKVSSAGSVRFFFGTNTADFFSSSRRFILDTPPADEWATVRFPVSTNAEWTGFITRMRMFPINVSGASMAIDWIRASDGDFDKDGISDADEGDADLDGDGLANYEDDDSDGDGKGDRAESAAAGRDPYDVSDLVFHFEDDDDFEGWTQSANVSDPAVSGGLLTGEATSNDPVFYHLDFHVPADQVDEIAVRFRSDAAGPVQFFFGTSAADSFSGTRRLNHPYTAPGEWQIARFPVASHLEWTGHITRMRIDPGTVSGSHFEIDWIRATGIPTNLTNLGGDNPVAGNLSPGALDFYTIPLAGLSRVIIRSGGATGTIGTLYGPGGSALNDPFGGPQFSIDRIIATQGELTVVVQGSDAGTSGPYELLVEVIPLEDSRPDATIGMQLTSQRGDDVYDPSGRSQKIRQVLRKRRPARIFFTIQNDAGLADRISVRGTGGNRKFKAIYTSLHGGANITASVRRAGFQATLNPLSDQPFLLRIKPTRRAKRGSRSFRVDASSAQVADRIMTRVKVR